MPSRPKIPEESKLDPALANALPLLLNAREVAALLRTSTKTIYNLSEQGRLPGVFRFGRKLLFRRDVLVRWIEAGTTPR